MSAREPAAAAIERSAVDQVRDAHQALDAAGVPRELAGAIRLSLVARIDWLDRRRIRPAGAVSFGYEEDPSFHECADGYCDCRVPDSPNNPWSGA